MRSQLATAEGATNAFGETIAAISTAPGMGAIGVVRVSGRAAADIARNILGSLPQPRQASVRAFRDADGEPIDHGVTLWFPSPGSYTGEDLLELQGHGGRQVLDLVLARVVDLGARPARPGEFTERAFLNGKLDLAQAEAVADLIEAATSTQARLAGRSLHGAFSRRIHALVEALTRLRMLVEAGFDFPDEDLESLNIGQADLDTLISDTEALLNSSHQGELIRDGLLVVIAGAPNAGKSSLLNALAETDAAIVTEIPGTTRDLLRAEIQVDGLPIRLIDTAGLRPAQDPVEQEGIRRARAQLEHADHVLLVVDDTESNSADATLAQLLQDGAVPNVPMTLIRNKADLTGRAIATSTSEGRHAVISCSALTGAGLHLVRDQLKSAAGYLGPDAGEFLARRRHVDAINRALVRLQSARAALIARAGHELIAEDLRGAQNALGEITGTVTSDDLLGRIFRDFCIGK